MSEEENNKVSFKHGLMKARPLSDNREYGVVDPVLFEQGYQHGLKSTKLICFKKSFRLGFRKAMLERKDQRMPYPVKMVVLGTPPKK